MFAVHPEGVYKHRGDVSLTAVPCLSVGSASNPSLCVRCAAVGRRIDLPWDAQEESDAGMCPGLLLGSRSPGMPSCKAPRAALAKS